MEFLAPADLDQALAVKAQHPDAVPIMGGTDVMVELNFDRRRPERLLDLGRVDELRSWTMAGEAVRLGAGVSYARVMTELGTLLPGLAQASRTVGSPQIRNRGSIGGNLGAASPAGDAHPPLLAAGAEVELGSLRGVRRVPVADFFLGPKRHTADADELVTAVWITPPRGPQQFSKVGTRNAMVIAVCAFAFALHPDRQCVGTGIGSAGPTPLRATDAERFLADELTAANLWEHPTQLSAAVIDRFAALAAAATSPIDDARGTASYRRHAVAVLARRTLTWAWADYINTQREDG